MQRVWPVICQRYRKTLVFIVILNGMFTALITNTAFGYGVTTNYYDRVAGTFSSSAGLGKVWWDTISSASGANWTASQVMFISLSLGIQMTAFNGEWYVPAPGQWKMRTRKCPAPVNATNCTIAKSSGFIDSTTTTLNATQTIYNQSPSFTYSPLQIPAYTSLCYTLVNIASGKEYRTDSMQTCQDAASISHAPLMCTVNGNTDLTVSLNTLERAQIGTQAGTTASVQKQISVSCPAGAALNVKIQFQYVPMTAGSDQVVQTSTPGLGVAILYENKAMKPTDTKNISFLQGLNQLNLAFEAVRAPSVPVTEISTGNFQANASMIMTAL